VAKSQRRRQTVAVFGGGIAGLTAAHELAERGFDVTVYERRAWGGKARSTVVPGSGRGGRMPLPGEHGYRYEFGYYQNLPDTMRRVPFESNPRGVFDNLVDVPQTREARAKKADVMFPHGPHAPQAYTPQEVIDLVMAVLLQFELPPNAVSYFASRAAARTRHGSSRSSRSGNSGRATSQPATATGARRTNCQRISASGTFPGCGTASQ
jgi:uncharacterized protein with NAD-binding domain and iron-sulfur cluster